jgi:hypothetical protein
MGQTVTPRQPQDYGAWVGATLREIGARGAVAVQQAPTVTAPQGVAMPRPVLPPAAAGKGTSKFPGAGWLRSQAFGERNDRRNFAYDQAVAAINYDPMQPIDDDINPAPWDPKRRDTQAEITNMHSDGTAAPVQIVRNGRTLDGNFYSAAGHNLKSSNGVPDTTRPAVLLLTGSGGRAEDQGLDLAKFYAESGASVLSLNYGGYGGSSDVTPTEQSVNQDAQAMLQHLIDLGYDPDKIIIHGYSMGGAVAGKLKEAMENPPAGGNPVTMRGLVLDRPMLSMAHGVMAKGGLPTPIGRTAASLTRQVLGKMGARSAISRSDKVVTPIVVTSDEGEFARQAEDFRTALRNNQQPTQVRAAGKVTGSQSNRDHFDHKANITQNANAMRALVQADRAGQPDATVGQPIEGLSDPRNTLAARINTAYTDVDTASTKIAQVVGKFEAQMPRAPPGRLQQQIDAASVNLDDVRDLLQDTTNTVSNRIKQQLRRNEASLRASLQKMLAMQEQLARNNPALVTASVPSRALVDSIADDGEAAVQALQTAGGPAPDNLALENNVINAAAALIKVGGQQHAKAQVIGTMVNQIRLRRQQARDAADRVRAARLRAGPVRARPRRVAQEGQNQ